ncbi:acetyl-CoA hydrolase [Apophysomyces sp. BC1015]|nr:acetyl-CoA hydrolase [Apophysomyces sp. BC1015]
MHIETNKFYAVKIINKKLMEGREHMIRNEINILRKISEGHENILSLVDYFETLNNLYLVTDLAMGGELFDRICQKGSYFERDAANIVRTVSDAAAYLHDNGIVHRDLKPENLLFRTRDEDADLLVADFGLSRIMDSEKFHVLTTTCGTPGYMAPEIFKKTGHGKPVDVWAIGVITYFLLCGYTPFERDNNIEEMNAIMNADYTFDEQWWSGISEEVSLNLTPESNVLAKDFVRRCLTIDPAKRMTAHEALAHPWLTSVNTQPTSPVDDAQDLLPGVRGNFNARRTFKKAVDLVRLSYHLGHKHSVSMGGGRPAESAEMASAALKARVRRPQLLDKLMSAEDTLQFFKTGQYMGWSGFTGVGYPKMIPTALADHVEKNGLQGKLKFNLFVGASTGAETEDRWAVLDMIDRRYPHQVGRNIKKGINAGRIRFADKHLSMFPQDLVYGFYTKDKKDSHKLDVVIVEATAITEDGWVVPGASVGATPELLQMTDKIIIEVNTRIPSFEGLHDITTCNVPPSRLPYLIMGSEDRIGTAAVPIDPEKVIAVVESDRPDNTGPNTPADATSKAIAGHLIDFLSSEVNQGRLPENLLPLQSGIGNIANAVIGGLASGPFENVMVFTEVLQDTFLDFFDSHKLKYASATSIRFSPDGFNRFYDKWAYYKDMLVLRSQQVSNSPEVIRRLGSIAMNTPVEFDASLVVIYGHGNSTMVCGSSMLNGLGGSADFLRNAKLSIMHTPSTRPTKTDPTGVSCIVPFASHVDQTEHDLDVYVTEQGLADLRGLCPRERAQVIIDRCAHPDYKPLLQSYLDQATKICLAAGRAHEPHMLDKAFKMHTNLLEKGTMKIDGW